MFETDWKVWAPLVVGVIRRLKVTIRPRTSAFAVRSRRLSDLVEMHYYRRVAVACCRSAAEALVEIAPAEVVNEVAVGGRDLTVLEQHVHAGAGSQAVNSDLRAGQPLRTAIRAVAPDFAPAFELLTRRADDRRSSPANATATVEKRDAVDELVMRADALERYLDLRPSPSGGRGAHVHGALRNVRRCFQYSLEIPPEEA